MDKTRIDAAIQEIVEWVTTSYVDENGGLPRGISSKGVHSAERLYNDLGDYLPFFAFLGQIDFCQQQLKDLRRIRRPDYLLPAEFTYAGLPCIRSYEHSDYLLGLLDTYEIMPSEVLRQDLMNAADSIWNTFFAFNAPRSWYFPSLRQGLPLTDTKDGMFIEIFVVLAKVLNLPIYLDRARHIAESLVSMTEQKGYPLVQNVIGAGIMGRSLATLFFRKATQTYTPVKYISNTLCGILELYKNEPHDRWRHYLETAHAAIEHDMIDADGAVHALHRQNGQPHPDPLITLVHNFPILDWCVDCAHFLHDERYLKTAKKIAAYWMNLQDPHTGLLPHIVGRPETDIDEHTDMSVALYKLSEVSHEPIYAQAAKRIIQGIFTYHRNPPSRSYAHRVDRHTGNLIEPDCKVKFVCLWLKALFVARAEGSVYASGLYELVKDR